MDTKNYTGKKRILIKLKNIKFVAENDFYFDVLQEPEPAGQCLPDWYKKTPKKMDERFTWKFPPYFQGPEKFLNATVKPCIPFFDAMSSGYLVRLSSDVEFVDEKVYNNRVIWPVSYEVVGAHQMEQVPNMPMPFDDPEVFKWIFHFIIKTPKDYSCLFSHPVNDYSLPFFTLSGIVDTDSYIMPISFPFIIDKKFMGRIPAGTPICQILPFKRDDWKKTKEKNPEKMNVLRDRYFSMAEKSYKKRFWTRKSFK